MQKNRHFEMVLAAKICTYDSFEKNDDKNFNMRCIQVDKLWRFDK